MFFGFWFKAIYQVFRQFVQTDPDPVGKARLAPTDVLPGRPDHILAFRPPLSQDKVPVLKHLLDLPQRSGDRDETVQLCVLLRRQNGERMRVRLAARLLVGRRGISRYLRSPYQPLHVAGTDPLLPCSLGGPLPVFLDGLDPAAERLRLLQRNFRTIPVLILLRRPPPAPDDRLARAVRPCFHDS